VERAIRSPARCDRSLRRRGRRGTNYRVRPQVQYRGGRPLRRPQPGGLFDYRRRNRDRFVGDEKGRGRSRVAPRARPARNHPRRVRARHAAPWAGHRDGTVPGRRSRRARARRRRRRARRQIRRGVRQRARSGDRARRRAYRARKSERQSRPFVGNLRRRGQSRRGDRTELSALSSARGDRRLVLVPVRAGARRDARVSRFYPLDPG